MSNTWFSSDLHFDHQNILTYCPDRPWSNAKQMNSGLIKNFNELVRPEDDLWILGDFRPFDGSSSVQALRHFTRRLNGRKHLIVGNHDEKNVMDYVNAGFLTVHSWYKLEEFNLIHDPAACICGPDQKWLYGHLHQNTVAGKNLLNVGVDRWKMKPVSIEQVRKHFKKQTK